MHTIASQITSLTIVYSIVYSGTDQRKHQSSASLAFVRGIHRGPVNSPHKGPVTRKMFPFDDVIMFVLFLNDFMSFPLSPVLLITVTSWWASLTFVRGIHRWPVDIPRKGAVARKMCTFDDVIIVVFVSYASECTIQTTDGTILTETERRIYASVI